MYNKILGSKILSTDKRNGKSKLVYVTSIPVAIVLVMTILILSTPIENVLANPCSHNSGGNGGNGGNGGPGGTGGVGEYGTGTGNTGGMEHLGP